MELKDFKDVVRVTTKEEFESTIEEDIKLVCLLYTSDAADEL
mgnify:CR=1 FL=1